MASQLLELESAGFELAQFGFEAGYISSFAKYRDGEVRASGWVSSDED